MSSCTLHCHTNDQHASTRIAYHRAIARLNAAVTGSQIEVTVSELSGRTYTIPVAHDGTVGALIEETKKRMHEVDIELFHIDKKLVETETLLKNEDIVDGTELYVIVPDAMELFEAAELEYFDSILCARCIKDTREYKYDSLGKCVEKLEKAYTKALKTYEPQTSSLLRRKELAQRVYAYYQKHHSTNNPTVRLELGGCEMYFKDHFLLAAEEAVLDSVKKYHEGQTEIKSDVLQSLKEYLGDGAYHWEYPGYTSKFKAIHSLIERLVLMKDSEETWATRRKGLQLKLVLYMDAIGPISTNWDSIREVLQ